MYKSQKHSAPFKNYKKPEWLKEQLEKGISVQEIADMEGVNRASIYWQIKKNKKAEEANERS